MTSKKNVSRSSSEIDAVQEFVTKRLKATPGSSTSETPIGFAPKLSCENENDQGIMLYI